jgi:hypothetical protein
MLDDFTVGYNSGYGLGSVDADRIERRALLVIDDWKKYAAELEKEISNLRQQLILSEASKAGIIAQRQALVEQVKSSELVAR